MTGFLAYSKVKSPFHNRLSKPYKRSFLTKNLQKIPLETALLGKNVILFKF